MNYLQPETTNDRLVIMFVFGQLYFCDAFSAQRLVALWYSYDASCSFIELCVID